MQDVFEALSDVHRRRVLVTLLEVPRKCADGGTVPAAFHETDSAPSNTRVALRHVHLPHLDRVDFIEWDRETGEVQRGPRFGEIRPVLELFEGAQELPGEWT